MARGGGGWALRRSRPPYRGTHSLVLNCCTLSRARAAQTPRRHDALLYCHGAGVAHLCMRDEYTYALRCFSVCSLGVRHRKSITRGFEFNTVRARTIEQSTRVTAPLWCLGRERRVVKEKRAMDYSEFVGEASASRWSERDETDENASI
ncbi:hypothetical protein EVAR_69996_1 [Eumeta japonica]|uniref:Uncharacterized protein n=1 Tax=Eumeta variegata TaxID=151549 RepID=A0A4C2A1J6_EUMVA|nr:hypothetical protein EVAR_69996_1 [Eumeta japonica]